MFSAPTVNPISSVQLPGSQCWGIGFIIQAREVSDLGSHVIWKPFLILKCKYHWLLACVGFFVRFFAGWPFWWVEIFRKRYLDKQSLAVRMCHVGSWVHSWLFDPFTGNLLVHCWLRLDRRHCHTFEKQKWMLRKLILISKQMMSVCFLSCFQCPHSVFFFHPSSLPIWLSIFKRHPPKN